MTKRQKGFTLIEFMCVVALIGLPAAIAILAYKDYTVRAQVTEGLNLAAAAKAAVAESYLNKGVGPVDRVAAGMSKAASDTSGKYVTGVDVLNGTITIAYGNEANKAIGNPSLTLELAPYVTPDGSIAWRCGGAPAPVPATVVLMTGAVWTGGTIHTTGVDKYLPSACRP